MSSILVTGAAGFIGSHLTEALIQAGHRVVGIDNFFRGKKENLQSLQGHPKFQLIEMDLSKSNCVEVLHKFIHQHHIDTIYHLAAINGTQYFYDFSSMVLHHNVMITMNLMQAVAQTPVKKIIYTSSSEVYGDPMKVPTPETHLILLNADADRDSYAASKAIGEYYVRLFCNQENMEWLIFRVFNTYGPRMVNTKYGQVIPEFIQRILSEDQFTLIGDGHHTRSFCFVTDLIQMILALNQKNVLGFMNVGNSDEIDMLNLAKKLHALMHKNFNPVFLPERPHDHHRRCPDVTRALSHLDSFSYTSLQEGLQKTIHYYERLLSRA